MSAVKCACGVTLNWREKHDGICRACDTTAEKDGTVPYPGHCIHPSRCDGLSSCPRDWSCVE